MIVEDLGVFFLFTEEAIVANLNVDLLVFLLVLHQSSLLFPLLCCCQRARSRSITGLFLDLQLLWGLLHVLLCPLRHLHILHKPFLLLLLFLLLPLILHVLIQGNWISLPWLLDDLLWLTQAGNR